MGDAGRRNIYFSTMAIPGHLIMSISKVAVLLFSFSWFLAANALFTFGLGAVKLLVVLADRRGVAQGSMSGAVRTYRVVGLVVFGMSVVYVASCLPLVFGISATDEYSRMIAIVVLTIAIVELVFSVHGLFSSRRRSDLLMEAVKFSNLASSLVLLVLAQSALLSLTAGKSMDPITHEPTTDPSRYNGLSGVALGTVAAFIGLYMVVRSRRQLLAADSS